MGLAVGVPVDSTFAPSDSVDASYERVTKFTMGGGGGRYYREILFPYMSDCGTSSYSVPFKEDYIDVGAEFDYQADRVTHWGFRGGYIQTDATLVGVIDTVIAGAETPNQQDTGYINPYVSFEWKQLGLGAGALFSTHPLHDGDSEDYPVDTGAAIYPSAHLRFGSLSRLYISGHLWEGVPIYSGGGMLMAGVGVRPVKPLELYGGYCAEGPYQTGAWLGRLTIDIGRSWTILTTVRFPVDYSSEYSYDFSETSESEYGIGVGISYRWYTLTDAPGRHPVWQQFQHPY
jgi:hypothetical protein